MNIYISGASSGIGEYLAYEYASKGCTLGLSARREDRLVAVSDRCRELGAIVHTYSFDVSDQNLSRNVALDFIDNAGGIDIVIANAGIGGEDNIVSGDSSSINKIIEINIIGVSNTVIPFIPYMKRNRSGFIAIISSIASFIPVPGHGGYSSSKVAVRFLAESFRYSLSDYNISVSSICPGYIRSEMTDSKNVFMPFLMDTDIAARKIVRAIDRRKEQYIFPWQWRLFLPILAPIIRFFPFIVKKFL